MSLSSLSGSAEVQTLQGIRDARSWSLPLPALSGVDTASLHLQGTSSSALNRQSSLLVKIDGHVIAQLPLHEAGAFSYDVALPSGLLTHGYNSLQIEAHQHYTDRCEYPLAPQLWTQIDVAASRIDLQLHSVPWPLRLDALDSLFDKTVTAETQVSVRYAASQASGSKAALAATAQGIALRYVYVPTTIDARPLPADLATADGAHAPWAALQTQLPADARTAVLVGTRKELSAWLPAGKEVEPGRAIPAQGAVVAALRWPDDPLRQIIVITGDDSAQVERAARAFAQPGLQWPPLAAVGVDALTDSDKQLLAPPLRTMTRAAYRLWEAGYTTRTLDGIHATAHTMRIWNGGWQRRAQLRLHVEYAAGMSTQSALNLRVNGVMQGSLPLDNPEGGRYADYAVSISPNVLHPGWNELTLEPVLIPISNGGDCMPFFPGNLAVTVFDDSMFEWVGGTDAQRADLTLLTHGLGGWLTRADGSDLSLVLADDSADTLSAALTLAGKFAQLAHEPLPALQMLDTAPETGATIWVGKLAGLPDTLRESAGISAQGVHIELVDGSRRAERIITRDLGRSDLVTPVTSAWGSAQLRANLDTLTLAAVADWNGRPVAVFTALDASALRNSVSAIIDYGAWAQLRGRLAWWQTGASSADLRVGSVGWDDRPFRYFGLRGGLGMWISRHPWWSLAILLALITGFVLAGRLALRSLQASRSENGHADA